MFGSFGVPDDFLTGDGVHRGDETDRQLPQSGFQNAATSDASGTNIVNLQLGGTRVSDTGHSLYVGYGHALTDETWYDEIVRFEYRFSV